MKKIVVLGASSSKSSINKTLAIHAASKICNATVAAIDLNDYVLPLYSIDAEGESGIPEEAHRVNQKIACADGLVISLAEHNGSYTAVFKNLLDWLSRIDSKNPRGKPTRHLLEYFELMIAFEHFVLLLYTLVLDIVSYLLLSPMLAYRIHKVAFPQKLTSPKLFFDFRTCLEYFPGDQTLYRCHNLGHAVRWH